MTPARLSTILSDLAPLGLTAARVVHLFGYASEHTARQWKASKVEIPAHVAEWLEQMHAFFLAHPPNKR